MEDGQSGERYLKTNLFPDNKTFYENNTHKQ